MLKEFKLVCTSSTLRFVPEPVKVSAPAEFFEDVTPTSDSRMRTFQGLFVAQVATLARADVNTFNMILFSNLNDAQSRVNFTERYEGNHFDTNGSFAQRIQARIDQLGLNNPSDPANHVTPLHLVRRAQALACNGCHQFSNNADLGRGIRFPSSTGFVHSTEQLESDPDEGINRFRISDALTDVFLPFRQTVLQDFLVRSSAELVIQVRHFGTDNSVAFRARDGVACNSALGLTTCRFAVPPGPMDITHFAPEGAQVFNTSGCDANPTTSCVLELTAGETSTATFVIFAN